MEDSVSGVVVSSYPPTVRTRVRFPGYAPFICNTFSFGKNQ